MTKKFFEARLIADGKLWHCNPELNLQCNKMVCKYNKNAIMRDCYLTSKKECALKKGQVAAVKEYTPYPPGQKKHVLIRTIGDRCKASTI